MKGIVAVMPVPVFSREQIIGWFCDILKQGIGLTI
jgi:hypothetical protein